MLSNGKRKVSDEGRSFQALPRVPVRTLRSQGNTHSHQRGPYRVLPLLEALDKGVRLSTPSHCPLAVLGSLSKRAASLDLEYNFKKSNYRNTD